MRSLAAVILQIGSELRSTELGRRVRFDVRPFPQQRLDKALGLPVGPRRIGAGAKMPETEGLTRDAPGPGHVAAAVVAHHALGANAPRLQPSDGALEKRGAGGAELVREDFDVGHPAVIVDRHVHVLPANAPRVEASVPLDPVPDLADAPERFDVYVQEITRTRPLA
jgi:hypothetical protein